MVCIQCKSTTSALKANATMMLPPFIFLPGDKLGPPISKTKQHGHHGNDMVKNNGLIKVCVIAGVFVVVVSC